MDTGVGSFHDIDLGEWRGICSLKLDKNELLSLIDGWDGLKTREDVRAYKISPETEVFGLTLKTADGDIEAVAKRYKYRGAKDIAKRLAGHGPARKFWNGTMLMIENGISVPRPLAFLEPKKTAKKIDSYAFMEEYRPAQTVCSFVENELGSQPAERKQFAGRLGGLFREMHTSGLYHRDLKCANLLVRRINGNTDFEIVPIDLEDVRKVSTVSKRKRINNLAQLVASLAGISSVSGTDGMRLWRAYSDGLQMNPGDAKRMIRAVIDKVAQRRSGGTSKEPK